jgi:pilus assembly protein CpaE
VPASLILVLESDPESASLISAVLSGASREVTVLADAKELLDRAEGAGLIILGSAGAGTTGAYLVCCRIRETPALATVPLLCITEQDNVDERIAFLEAGADDVMVRPFDARELEARVEALLLRASRSRDAGPDTDLVVPIPLPIYRMVAAFSPKGGVGTSTIATNVAVATAQRRPERVLLMDFDLQFGQAATMLNLPVRQSLADLVRDPAALREPEILRTYAARHDSGLHLLAAPPTPDLGSMVELAHVDPILDTALRSYDSLVIDAGSILDERSLAILERADAVILPISADIAALKSAHSLLEHLAEIGSIGSRVMIVLNGMFAKEILRLPNIESALGISVTLQLPYDAFVYLKAANEGVPVVIGAPRSKAAEQLRKLAMIAFGEEEKAAVRNGSRKRGRIGSLVRRG